MKNLFTTLFFVLSIFIFSKTNAQTFPYFLEVESEVTYSDLMEATELTSAEDFWDDPEYIVPIGFEFEFYGDNYSAVYFAGLGSMLSFKDPNSTSNTDLIFPNIDDLIDIENIDNNMNSTISYTTEGDPGSLIFKLEWKDCGFYNEVSDQGTINNRTSFQMWLYEGSNNIEFRYGPNMIPDPQLVHDFGAPICGIIENYDFTTDNFDNFWHLTGSASAPDITFADSTFLTTYMLAGLDSSPSTGQLYRFATESTSTTNLSQTLDLKVYPTLITDEFYLEVNEEIVDEESQLNIVNNLGQNIYTQKITSTKERLNASSFPKGIFHVVISNKNGVGTKKIIKN